MKNIVASVSLVALGASGLQAATVPGFSGETPKPWSVALTLRGFYDDNINANAGSKESVYGVEASPSVSLNWSRDQTSVSASYIYAIKYYDHTPQGNSDRFDQTHTFNLSVNHAFSPRYQISAADSFVIGQEPDMLRAGQALNTFERLPGDNMRNYGTINLDGQITPVFGFQLGYANSLFDYHDEGGFDAHHLNAASQSGLLDRLEHEIHIDARFQLEPNTVGLVGYKFRLANYTGNEVIDETTGYKSEVRDSRMHYVYGGIDHNFRPDLTASLRAGASFIEYYNDPTNPSDVAPYVMASLRYTYMIESYLEAGFSYDRTATDQFSVADNGSILHDAQTGTLWGSLNHRLAPQLYGGVTGQIQNSTYQGGVQNNQDDWFYLVGVSLEYRFSRYLSCHAGYNFDKLNSQIAGRDFDRNRVYIGLTAGY